MTSVPPPLPLSFYYPAGNGFLPSNRLEHFPAAAVQQAPPVSYETDTPSPTALSPKALSAAPNRGYASIHNTLDQMPFKYKNRPIQTNKREKNMQPWHATRKL